MGNLLSEERKVLPNRRESVVLDVWHNEERYHVAYSRDPGAGYPNTPIREIFIHGPKSGSDLDAISLTVAVILSMPLQRGATLDELSHSAARLPDSNAADFIGTVIDTLRKEEPW